MSRQYRMTMTGKSGPTGRDEYFNALKGFYCVFGVEAVGVTITEGAVESLGALCRTEDGRNPIEEIKTGATINLGAFEISVGPEYTIYA